MVFTQRDFDKESDKLHMKNHSEKWGSLGG